MQSRARASRAPAWAKDAVIYQIFPDRFRNGRKDNDPKTGDVRYDDPVLKLGWGVLPEGYCRNYADGATQLPVALRRTPPTDSPRRAAARPRLHGRRPQGRRPAARLPPVAGRQRDLLQPDLRRRLEPLVRHPGLHEGRSRTSARQKDFDNLVKHAEARSGSGSILDGVFNHMSSDSPLFDRYHHYPTVGACESATSPYRAGSRSTTSAPAAATCVGSDRRPNSARYDGWFGFDSHPRPQQVAARGPGVLPDRPRQRSRSTGSRPGASGWRMDVSGDASLPERATGRRSATVVKAHEARRADRSARRGRRTSTLLRMIRGDRLDTTMNYRLRDAVIGFLAPGDVRLQGLRRQRPRSSSRRSSSTGWRRMREDYPDAAYYSLMNLLDSHDTERLLWTLTPGAETTADTRAERRQRGRGQAARRGSRR